MKSRELKALQKALGYKFKNPDLLRTALTHPSFQGEEGTPSTANNQRLEFLGDAVVGLLSAESLYAMRPELDEGQMTKLRSVITSRGGLAALGAGLDLGRYLSLGKGEQQSGGSERESNLADAMEAVLGAIYLDGSHKACRKWFQRHLQSRLEELVGVTEEEVARGNPKGTLQEWLQAQGKPAPGYEILKEEGPAHNRSYVAGVYSEGALLATGSSSNKKAAEAEAAANAIRDLTP